MNETLDRAEAVLVEGRHRVRDLRTVSNGLAETLTGLARELAVDNPAIFNLTVEGPPYPLAPATATEVQSIAEEAPRNAFRHAQARRIEAAISYLPSELRLSFADDGKGLPSDFEAKGGRDGRYGLTGMRERADGIGASLAIRSRPDRGTEVALRVPRVRVPDLVVGLRARLPRFLKRWLAQRPARA